MSMNKNYGLFHLKLAKKFITTIIIITLFELLSFSAPTLAQTSNASSDEATTTDEICSDIVVDDNPYVENIISTQKSIEKGNKYGKIHITAYNSEPGQTDDSPCITANGYNLCKNGKEDSIAANFLPFGTKVRIPELFGDRVFVVRDRMHHRFTKRVDVWMAKRDKAIKFGIKSANIEIVE